MIGSIFPDDVNAALDAHLIALGTCKVDNEPQAGCGRPSTLMVPVGEKTESFSPNFRQTFPIRNICLAVRRNRCACGLLWVSGEAFEPPAGFDVTVSVGYTGLADEGREVEPLVADSEV